MLELGAIPLLAPMRMVAILLAALRVAPGRLDVAARIGADPDVRPRGRDRQRADAVERRVLPDRLSVGVSVGEAGAGPASPDARRVVGYINEPRLGGRLRRIVQSVAGIGR
jgi:hypothetical protein